MKKVLFSIAILAVAFGFTACSNEDEALGNVKGEKTTVLAMTEVGTRTALSKVDDKTYNVVWSEGDKIYISDCHSQYKEFELKSGAGETTATFEGETPADGEYYAFYATRFATFESTQYYEAGKVCNFPMCASATVTGGKIGPLEFWNMGGMLSLTVKGTATIKSIQVTSEQSMAGPIDVSQKDHTATCSYDCKKVTLDCGDGVALTAEGTVFNIALLANDYTGVAITLTDTDGKTCTKTFKGTALKIERSKITTASFTASFAAPTTGTAKRTGDVDVKWVQLWKDGPKFAEYNVGATSATEYGGYYAWGGHEDMNASDYYTGTGSLSGTDDTAYNLWGENWRMPTSAELQALLDNCTCTWTENYQETGVKGFLCTGNGDYASNSIFIPAAGYEANYVNERVRYWSSTPDESKQKCSFYLMYNPGSPLKVDCRNIEDARYSVRPVLNEAPAAPVTTGTEKRTGDVDVNWVQLWAGGPKFAEYNVGATNNKAEDYGGYYCWGNSSEQSSTWTGAAGTDDIATALWGSKWRMPTKEEFENLLANCTCTWDGTNNGLLCTGNGDFSSNSVFLPAAGTFDGGDVIELGSGYYWSSTAYSTKSAYTLNFESGYQGMGHCPSTFVYSVRAVLNETK